MRKYILIITSILVLAVYLSTGCKKEDDTNTEFIILVDSLRMPDTVSFGSMLEIDFYGLVGTNDCYTFSQVKQLESTSVDPQNSIRFQLYGDYVDNGNCQGGGVYMNPVTTTLSGMLPGTFAVLVQQPDGTVMTGFTYVEE